MANRRLVRKCIKKHFAGWDTSAGTLAVLYITEDGIWVKEESSIPKIILALVTAQGGFLIRLLNEEELSEFLVHHDPEVRGAAQERMKALETRSFKWLFRVTYFLKHLSFYKRPRLWKLLVGFFGCCIVAGTVVGEVYDTPAWGFWMLFTVASTLGGITTGVTAIVLSVRVDS